LCEQAGRLSRLSLHRGAQFVLQLPMCFGKLGVRLLTRAMHFGQRISPGFVWNFLGWFYTPQSRAGASPLSVRLSVAIFS